MAEFQLADPLLAEYMNGRKRWPTEEELIDMEKDKDRAVTAAPVEAPATVLHSQQAAPGETHTPAADVFETTPDGRTIQIAAAGVPLPVAEAKRLGIIKGAPATGPTEKK